MSPKAYQRRQIICEMCGRQCRAELKNRDICRMCLRKQPCAQCSRCGRRQRYIDGESGVCPRCLPIATRPVAVCAGCSSPKAISNLEAHLCQDCHREKRRRERNKDKQVQITCSVCGQQRSSALLEQAICAACWRERRNGQGICSRCNKFKVIQVKEKHLCKQCYKHHLAPNVLRRYVEEFTAPYPYNKALFDVFIVTINWETVTEKTHQTICTFGRFLQTQSLPEPLTWEAVENLLPPLGPTNRNNPKYIRACLLRLAHTLAMKGELESWERYVARRNTLVQISRAPEQIHVLLRRYVSWLRERQSAPSNIREHLDALISFWQWCELRGVHSPEQVQASLVNDYLLSLYWQWQCSICQGTIPFEPGNHTASGSCVHCRAIGSLTKQKRYAQNTVRTQRGGIFVFFEWLKISRMVIANPVQRKIPAPEPTIRHYSPEIIKQLCMYLKSPDANPIEALVLYLIIFHALSVWELRHAVLPTILPLREGIAIPSLAEAYYIIVPRPAPSRGDHSPGRPDIRLDFPSAAAPWLKPLLRRFEHQRQGIAGASTSSYVLLTPMAVRHNTVVGHVFIWKVVGQASRQFLNAACNPNTLRKTAGVMFADRAGAGVLRWMGWDEQQAFAYAYAARELVRPRPLDETERVSQQASIEPIIFPSPKESSSNATTQRTTSTD